MKKSSTSVKGVEYPVKRKFDMFHLGWECDSDGFVIDDAGSLRLVLTNHGTPYFADLAELMDKIKELEGNCRQLRTVIGMFEARP